MRGVLKSVSLRPSSGLLFPLEAFVFCVLIALQWRDQDTIMGCMTHKGPEKKTGAYIKTKNIMLVVKKLFFIVGSCCIFLVNNTQARCKWTSAGPYGGIIDSLTLSDSNSDIIFYLDEPLSSIWRI